MDEEPTGLTDPAVSGFLDRAARLLGNQSAEVADRLDRWFTLLSADLARLQRLADGRAAPQAAAPARPTAASGRLVLPPPAPPPATLVAPSMWRLRLWQPPEGWTGWADSQTADLLAGGLIEVRTPASRAAILTLPTHLQSGGLHRVRVRRGAGPTAWLRVLDSRDRPLAPDHVLPAGETELFFFAPHRLRTIRLMVLVEHAAEPLPLASVQLDAVDIETFWRSRAHLAPAPVIASLTSRALPDGGCAPALRDTVESLLLQCDEVRVLLLDHWQVPAFLRQPRIACRLCRGGEQLPGEGAFGWSEATDAAAFRVLIRDGVVVPPDFCAVLLAALARHDYRAVIGTGGAMVQVPPDGPPIAVAVPRHAASFATRTVHLLRRGAMMLHGGCLDPRIWALDDAALADPAGRDPALADIVLAVAAQQAGVPLLSLQHPPHWLAEAADPEAAAPLADVPAALLRQADLGLQDAGRPRVALILAGAGEDQPEDAAAAWTALLPPELDGIIVLAGGGGQRPRAAHLPHEVHRVAPLPDGRADIAGALALAARRGVSLVCIAAAGLRPRTADWLVPLARSCAGRAALGLYARADARGGTLHPATAGDALVLALIDGDSLRDVQGEAAAQSWLAPRDPPPGESGEGSDIATIAAGMAAVAGPAFRLPPALPVPPPARLKLLVGEVFERIVVLNADADFDRWLALQAALARCGIAAERARRVDPAWPEVALDYACYQRRRPARPRDGAAIQSDRALYVDPASQAARAAYVAHRDGGLPIAGIAAWADLRSWERVLARALRDGVAAVLVLRDDVAPDPRAAALFAAAAGQLPEDWLCLNLSAGPGGIPAGATRHARLLWRTHGLPAGSHAVGLRAAALPLVLAGIRRMDLGLEDGALAALARAWPHRCFAMAPDVFPRSG
jgi:hypothetical protein